MKTKTEMECDVENLTEMNLPEKNIEKKNPTQSKWLMNRRLTARNRKIDNGVDSTKRTHKSLFKPKISSSPLQGTFLDMLIDVQNTAPHRDNKQVDTESTQLSKT